MLLNLESKCHSTQRNKFRKDRFVHQIIINMFFCSLFSVSPIYPSSTFLYGDVFTPICNIFKKCRNEAFITYFEILPSGMKIPSINFSSFKTEDEGVMGHSFSAFAKFSERLTFPSDMHTHTYQAYHGVRNVCFFGKFCERTK